MRIRYSLADDSNAIATIGVHHNQKSLSQRLPDDYKAKFPLSNTEHAV
jgi:hypothetical protein